MLQNRKQKNRTNETNEAMPYCKAVQYAIIHMSFVLAYDEDMILFLSIKND